MTSNIPLIIVNPASANGSTGRNWPGLAARISNYFGQFNCVFTKKAGDAKDLAASAANGGRKFIIACGGDGTISEVVNGILSSDSNNIELGILPHGSGGDFRKTLDLPSRFEDAAHALANGISQEIDVGQVTFINTKKIEETRYFINVASFGMGGEVVKRTESSNKTFGGTLAYAYATLATTLSYECPEIFLQCDELAKQRWRIATGIVANGCYFGGGMKIAPNAELTDGLFDVVVVKELSKLAILANTHHLYAGTHLDLSYVASTKVKKIKAWAVDSKRIVRLELDGEFVGQLPATFELKAQKINIRCPKSKNFLALTYQAKGCID
ncbi:MAG: diacylglycerol kinase family lipid kinase [Blastocatellia bacterium]|nr:diacylglycerol kinase family lipid kinase [Blastocatellia bacterium]MBN8723727.1 diacylglycerol kinase family lipid kinase [Acidobacteriota bacterium]